MIRCNMCEKTFKTELDIPFIVRLENGETEFLRVGIPIKPGGETFRGCPHCMTDMYLMDMEDNENAS